MRSRYTAFVLQRRDYLLATWHPSTRPSVLDFENGARWLGLEVRAAREVDASHATVEFVARQKPPNGRAWRLHEVSNFAMQDGKWLYVDGVQL
jgi:SEC-C motif-containing protein